MKKVLSMRLTRFLTAGVLTTLAAALAIPALSLAAPLLVAAVALWINGRETSGRGLEEIQHSR